MEHEDAFEISRRRLIQLGTMSVGATILGSAVGATAHADADGSGADGAALGDTLFTGKVAASAAAAPNAVETSYNGWPVGTPASSIGVASFYAPGTSILIPVKSGDVATVLMYVAGRFNAEVEALQAGQVWGYAYRKNVNNPSVWSNHASGTAIDLNSALHPNSATGTFSAARVAAIRNILAYCGPVVYWGGDYRGTVDAMHFEIDVPPGSSQLPALVSRIQGGVGQSPVVSLRARANNMYVTAQNGGSNPLIASSTAIGQWEQFDLIDRGHRKIALRAHANNLYVRAENAGAAALIANSDAITAWETFTLVDNSDGTVSLRAKANRKYVTAGNGGAQPLIANSRAIDLSAKFDLIGA